jgi:probable HAF family extracellular repeat protein
LTDLGVPAGKINGTAWAINARGDAVGWAFDTDPEVNPIFAPPTSIPFVYDRSNGTRALPTPAGFKNGFAGDINDAGVAAGYAATNTATHMFVWTPGPHGSYTAIDLGIPPGYLHSSARAINNQGVVAGQGGRGAAAHAFVWVPGARGSYTPIDLGTLGFATSARDINDRGDVVGLGVTPDGEFHAFLHDAGVMHDLNDLIPTDSGWVLDTARSINDRGQIVGLGFHDGLPHAFLLDPAAASRGSGDAAAIPLSRAPAARYAVQQGLGDSHDDDRPDRVSVAVLR